MSNVLIVGDHKIQISTIKKLYQQDGMSWKEIATKYNTYPNKIARFAKTHNIKPRNHSESQSKLFELGKRESPTKGKKRSDAVKEKISKKQAQVWSGLSDTERAKRCKISKDAWDSKSPEEKQALFSAATRGILEAAKNGSKIEKYVQNSLRKANYIIETHKEDLLPGTKTHIDIFIPNMATAVEIDGPAHFSPIWGQDKLDKHIKKDNAKNARLIAAGFTVVRVKYMLSSSSLAKMRYASEEVIKALEKILDHPEVYNNTFLEIEVK